MARTPLARRLMAAFSIVKACSLTGQSVAEVQERLRSAKKAQPAQVDTLSSMAALKGASRVRPNRGRPSAAPRIVVVGAGIAGLVCAYRLTQAGFRPAVYEANDRVGGRMWTRRGFFADGQIAERGGELIDSRHTALLNLIAELGLPLDDLETVERPGTEPFQFFGGSPYRFDQVVNDLKALWPILQQDLADASYPTLHHTFTRRGWELDHMSIADWIKQYVPGGAASTLGRYLDTAYTIEYGIDAGLQSALNLHYMLGYGSAQAPTIFGPADEKYRVRGGNDLITTQLGDRLGNQIRTGERLVAIRQNGTHGYTLTFEHHSGVREVKADKVVLTVPFPVLRSTVDYKKAGFGSLKQLAIEQLGMSTSAKLHLQFTSRYWEQLGCNGETYSDTGYQNTWDASRAQPGPSGLLVNFTGGSTAAAQGGTEIESARRFLTQAEFVIPGLSDRWNGLVAEDRWVNTWWTGGSYSVWTVGQYTSFAGVEGATEGNCHFAGEHTSIDHQQDMNGAVESGERVAAEILKDLGASCC